MVYFRDWGLRTDRVAPPDPERITAIHSAFQHTEAQRLPEGLGNRLAQVAGVESVLAGVRYLLVLLYGSLGYMNNAPFGPIPLSLLCASFLAHNALVHFIHFRGRQTLYLGHVNLMIHVAQTTLLVTLTGAEKSPFCILYFFLLLAQVLYAPHFRRTYAVMLLCAAAFTAAVSVRWIAWGHAPAPLPLCVTYFGLFMCYELIRSLANLLYTIELGLQIRAQELASSKATLRTILDAADGPIVVYDDNEFISEANESACEFLQCPRESLLGTRFRQFFFDDGTLPGKLATLKARGEYQGEVIAILPEGDELNVTISVRSYMREGRRFFVALLHDITEQKHLQEATRNANIQLAKINRELQQVDTLRNEFFSTISQRLRSPLSAILGYTDLLLNEELGELNAPQRKALQTCRRSVSRVFSLVDEAFELQTPKQLTNQLTVDSGQLTARTDTATNDVAE